jgi:AraC-like DNA-binding protein
MSEIQKPHDKKEKQILKWILGKMYRAERKKQYLEQRLHRIAEERDAPIGGRGYAPLPRSSGKPSDGAATIIIRLSEIEERIYRQKEIIDKSINMVMDIIDYLPENEIEREIMERHHIDFMKWKDIAREIPMSRSQVNRRYNAALDQLLTYKRIRQIVEDHEEEYDAWKARKY